MFYVLDRTVEFVFEHNTTHAGPGTFVHVPAGVWHGFRCRQDARIVDFHIPGGFERFFHEAAEPCTDPAAPPPSPDFDRVLPLFAKHGMDLRT